MAAGAIIVGLSGYRGAARGMARRGATMAFVVLLHIAVITLFLARQDVLPIALPEGKLSVFDVTPPPVITPPEPPLPIDQPHHVAPAPGGSAGRAARTPAPAPPGPSTTMDATVVVDAPSAPPPRVGIGSAVDLMGPGAGGTARGTSSGLGNGIGNGMGNGHGDGSGSGGGIRWAMADWIEKPGPAEWRRVWPADALRYEVRGRVELACIVPRPGTPQACRIVSEKPAGHGFGRAALELSRLPTFRVKPVRENDRDRDDIPLLVPIIFTPIRNLPNR